MGPGERDQPPPGWGADSDFCSRVCAAFADLADKKALAEGQERLVILAHGGTQMAVLERFALPRRSFQERCVCGPNAGGYLLDARDWKIFPEQRVLHRA